MFWKDELAREIMSAQDISYSFCVSLQDKFPYLRVRTIDAKGKVPMIQFDAHGEWFKPQEWANNHLVHLRQQRSELQLRLKTLGCDPSDMFKSKSTNHQLESGLQSDPAEVQTLSKERDALLSMVKAYHQELLNIWHGEMMSLEMRQHIAECESTGKLRKYESGR